MEKSWASLFKVCEVDDAGSCCGLGANPLCPLLADAQQSGGWRRLDGGQVKAVEDMRHRGKGACPIANTSATHREVGHGVRVPDVPSPAPLLDHCVWCFKSPVCTLSHNECCQPERWS